MTAVVQSARPRPHVPQLPVPRIRSPRASKPRLMTPSDSTSRNPRVRRLVSPSDARLSPAVPDGPISPDVALSEYSALLMRYETAEILKFPEIYFIGERSRKAENPASNGLNRGFDSADHSYRPQIGDHLAYRYEVLGAFGAGAFGRVVRALDHKTGAVVAVKILINTPQMHDQGKIEAKLLAHLNHVRCSAIVRAYDFFVFRSHICITFEVLGANLYDVLRSANFAPVALPVVRRYAAQLLEALAVCHAAGVVHCDLKPENVLCADDAKSSVKLIDFGSGCFDGNQRFQYIQSRFYRAPEVVLGMWYGPPMDIWSLALIVIELMTGKPLFPADDELELLGMIAEIFGSPPPTFVAAGRRKGDFFDARLTLKPGKNRDRRPGSVSLAKAIGCNDPKLLDFLTKCLAWVPDARLTAEKALEHPWLRSTEVTISGKPTTNLPPVHTVQQ
jgi:dual specificity tyrosine-phosphorylation-regulated kinase 2/3/4